jgi:response regulator RpfG family c-di-GMP phosphodiesterase
MPSLFLPKILLVDDEPDVRQALEIRLGRRFEVTTAVDGLEGLAKARETKFEVVLADMSMPKMDGVTLLEILRRETPDCSRVLLTASSDIQIAVEAVNRGSLFRFLTKPWSTDYLLETLVLGSEAYRHRVQERAMLSGTLEPSLQVLVDLLALQRPREFGDAAAIADRARALCAELELADAWEVGIAASLRSLGILCRPLGTSSTPEEVARIGHDLLSHIPRLSGVAQILLYQCKNFDGSGYPVDDVVEESIPLGARILRVSADVHQMCLDGLRPAQIFKALALRSSWYDPKVVDAAKRCLRTLMTPEVESSMGARRVVSLSQLLPGHVLLEDLRTIDGVLLLTAGRRVSVTLFESLRHFAQSVPIQEPLFIATPDAERKMAG